MMHLRPSRWQSLVLILVTCGILCAGCSVNRHRIGMGPNGLGSSSDRQFYILFGLFQLNEADTERMSEDLTSYEIITEYSFTDILLSPLLIFLTMTSRTVTVNR